MDTLDLIALVATLVGITALLFAYRYRNYDPHHLYNKLILFATVALGVLTIRLAIYGLDKLIGPDGGDMATAVIIMRIVCVAIMVIAIIMVISGYKDHEPLMTYGGVVFFICIAALSYYMFVEIDLSDFSTVHF